MRTVQKLLYDLHFGGIGLNALSRLSGTILGHSIRLETNVSSVLIDTRFGDLIREALRLIGDGNPFFRMLIV